MNKFFTRNTCFTIMWAFLYAGVVVADEVADYIAENPDVGVYNVLVGTGTDTCDPECVTYDTVDLSVPSYVLNSIVEEFPAARNGIGDISIASISYDDELVTLKGDDTSTEPFYDGDTIAVLYKDVTANGDEGSSESVTTEAVVANYSEKPFSETKEQDRLKTTDQKLIQISKIQENLPGLDPETIMVAIDILTNEFKLAIDQNQPSLMANISEKVDLIDGLMSSGELSDYNLDQRYPRLKFFNEFNSTDRSLLTEDELTFLTHVNEDLTNLSGSIMRRNPELLVKGLYKKLLKNIRENNSNSVNDFKTGDKDNRTLSFSEHLFVADMMKSEFDSVFENLIDTEKSNYSALKKYNPKIIDQEFLRQKLELQDEVVLYLGLFKKEILDDRRVIESFSDGNSAEMDLTIQELKQRFLAKGLIDDLIRISEETRQEQPLMSEPFSSPDKNIDKMVLVKQVNAILDRSVDDMLAIINQDIDDEKITFWESLQQFLQLPFTNKEDEYLISKNNNVSEEIDLTNSEAASGILSKRQEIIDLAAIAAVMGYPVLGPP